MIPAMVVPVLTRPELLYRMLETVDAKVDHLIVIDNGGCVDDFECNDNEQIQRVSVIHMPANLGVAGSWNLGIKAAPFAPWWLVCNFDITWPAGSLARFVSEARVGALLLSGGTPPWCAFAVGEEIVSRVGLFDEALHRPISRTTTITLAATRLAYPWCARTFPCITTTPAPWRLATRRATL